MKHLIARPHVIFSVENPKYPGSLTVSHEKAIQALKNLGKSQVHSVKGHWGSPETSILISNPSEKQLELARRLAHATGQESHIESDGYSHKMYINNGPESGKIIQGKGTNFFESPPEDHYSILPDNTVFSHNFNFEKSEKPFHGYNKEKHSKTGGLNDSYREKYNRETGSNLKRPVTEKVKPGSKAAKRRKSFCARMKGVPGPTSKEGKLTPKGAALKRWKCSKSEDAIRKDSQEGAGYGLAASRLEKTANKGTQKFYHITDNPKFELNPNFTPEDNSIAVNDRSGQKGIYLTPDVEKWVNGHGYLRPYVAEFELDPSILKEPGVHGRWSQEQFIPASLHHKLKLNRVIPIDAHVRERFGAHGWVESGVGHEFDTGNKITAKSWESPFKGYKYEGKDVREMSPNEIKGLQNHFKAGYKSRFGVTYKSKFRKSELKKAAPLAPTVNLNPEHGKTIADAYEKMKHDPDHPAVKAAYNALIGETEGQFKKIIDSGFRISKIKPGQPNPYKNSKEMHHDIEHNKHLWYFPTEQGFGSESDSPKDHPMLKPTKFKHDEKTLLANDVFRIVHDINGHHVGGKSGFGPKGEHQAYLTHKKAYSPLAQRALFTETAMQNNWVNWSASHGEHNRAHPEKTVFAQQKAGIMPDAFINKEWHPQ